MIPATVRVYGALSEAALRQGVTSELVVWLVASELKQSPSMNCVNRRSLAAALRECGISKSSGYTRQLLRQGNGVFWHLSKRSVFLIGADKVADALDVGPGGRWRQEIAIADLIGRANRRGVLFGAAVRNDKPIAQATLQELTGVSARSQRRYRSKSNFDTIRQDGDLTAVTANLVSHKQRLAWAQEHRHEGVYLAAGGHLRKRLPNLHQARGKRLTPGSRTNQIFSGRLLKSGQGFQTVPRIWFDTTEKWTGCKVPKLGVDPRRDVDLERHFYADQGLSVPVHLPYIGPKRGFNVAWIRADKDVQGRSRSLHKHCPGWVAVEGKVIVLS